VEAAGLSLAIAATRWHPEVTDCLVQRAVAAAEACGVARPLVVRVPGAVELPVGAAGAAGSAGSGGAGGAGATRAAEPLGIKRLSS